MRNGATPARLTRACIAAIALSASGGSTLAAEPAYPAGPVKIIVSLPAGGVGDRLARITAQRAFGLPYPAYGIGHIFLRDSK